MTVKVSDSDSVTMSDTLNEQLISACKSGSLPAAQQAVTDGADINWVERGGYSDEWYGYDVTPIMVAIRSKHDTVTNWLLCQDDINVTIGHMYLFGNTLHVACWFSDNSDIVNNIGRKMDSHQINSESEYGVTPVQLAVQNGNVPAVLGLLPVHEVDWQVRHEDDGSLLDMAR